MSSELIAFLSSTAPWVLVLFFLLCSAVMSGSEVALFSLTPVQFKELEESEDSNSKNVIKLLRSPNPELASKRLIASILIGNNLANIAIVLLTSELAKNWLENKHWEEWLVFVVNVIGVTTIILLFGEIIPKVYATTNNVKIAKRVASLFLALDRIFSPVIWLLMNMGKWFEKGDRDKSENISVDELGHALELTQDENRSEEENRILEGIVTFGEKEVVQIMTSRTDIVFLDYTWSIQKVKSVILDCGFSRIPVKKPESDEVVGILHAKDLLGLLDDEDCVWTKFMRDVFFIPEAKQIDDLLEEFQHDKKHMAVVVDEYGSTVGLVTLQDILQEIVGDVHDEFDDAGEQLYTKLDNTTVIFIAKILLVDFYRVLDIDGEDYELKKGDSTTLGGFIVEQMGRIPAKGDTWVFHGHEFTIEAADNRKVSRIKMRIISK
jgi:gliding motility-associated protein GldE